MRLLSNENDEDGAELLLLTAANTAFICALFATKWRRAWAGCALMPNRPCTRNASINGIGSKDTAAGADVYGRFHGNLFVSADGRAPAAFRARLLRRCWLLIIFSALPRFTYAVLVVGGAAGRSAGRTLCVVPRGAASSRDDTRISGCWSVSAPLMENIDDLSSDAFTCRRRQRRHL